MITKMRTFIYVCLEHIKETGQTNRVGRTESTILSDEMLAFFSAWTQLGSAGIIELIK